MGSNCGDQKPWLNYFLPGLPVGRNSIPYTQNNWPWKSYSNSLKKWQFLVPMLDFRDVAAKKESRLVWHPTTVDVPKSCITWDVQKAADNGRFCIFFLGKQRFLLPINSSMSRFHEPSIFLKKKWAVIKTFVTCHYTGWIIGDPYNGLL